MKFHFAVCEIKYNVIPETLEVAATSPLSHYVPFHYEHVYILKLYNRKCKTVSLTG